MSGKKSNEIERKLDLIVKMLGMIICREKPGKNQTDQILSFYKRGLMNKEIADLFGIKAQQVNNALLRKKIKRK